MPRRKRSESAEDGDADAVVKSIELPTLTHLQFLIVDLIRSDNVEVSAQQVMGALSLAGVNQRGPKFYQLMRRLEESGLISSWQQRFDVAGGGIQRTVYKVTKQGLVAWRLVREFYAVRLNAKTIFE
jgi:hypothetical protein